MLQYIKVCSKAVKTKEGKAFDAYFGYRQQLNEDNNYEDVLTPGKDKDGKPIMFAKSIRVALTDVAKKKLVAEDNFPYVLALEDGREPLAETELEQPDFYVIIDKDKDKVARLDKNGKQHLIAIISNFRNAVHAEPMSSLSLDDLDSF